MCCTQVALLEKKDRAAENVRIQEQLITAASDSLSGSWQNAWKDIVTRYPHVATKAEWWCDPLVMSMFVFAERGVIPTSDVPNSTNQEEGNFASRCRLVDDSLFLTGTHPQGYLLGTQLSPLQGIVANRQIDEAKHEQAKNAMNNFDSC